MARGFARFRCDGCAREILVAFSCKGRICPSCSGRRMGELAAHLVDGVLGGLPVRQWVLTLPFRLRYRLAYDHRLCRAVLEGSRGTLGRFGRFSTLVRDSPLSPQRPLNCPDLTT